MFSNSGTMASQWNPRGLYATAWTGHLLPLRDAGGGRGVVLHPAGRPLMPPWPAIPCPGGGGALVAVASAAGVTGRGIASHAPTLLPRGRHLQIGEWENSSSCQYVSLLWFVLWLVNQPLKRYSIRMCHLRSSSCTLSPPLH